MRRKRAVTKVILRTVQETQLDAAMWNPRIQTSKAHPAPTTRTREKLSTYNHADTMLRESGHPGPPSIYDSNTNRPHLHTSSCAGLMQPTSNCSNGTVPGIEFREYMHVQFVLECINTRHTHTQANVFLCTRTGTRPSMLHFTQLYTWVDTEGFTTLLASVYGLHRALIDSAALQPCTPRRTWDMHLPPAALPCTAVVGVAAHTTNAKTASHRAHTQQKTCTLPHSHLAAASSNTARQRRPRGPRPPPVCPHLRSALFRSLVVSAALALREDTALCRSLSTLELLELFFTLPAMPSFSCLKSLSSWARPSANSRYL